MINVLISFFLLLVVFSLFLSSLFTYSTRLSSAENSFKDALCLNLSSTYFVFAFYCLFVALVTSNVLGNIPLNSIPTIFYSQTLTLSLLFWLPLMLCVSNTQFKDFLAHMLPYGAPVSLILFLPIIEVFSQLIRPFTLMVRISTNLSAGHIMMYMFSYFTLLSDFLSPFICIVISVLFVLELAISLLQAYIFVSLISLYFSESY